LRLCFFFYFPSVTDDSRIYADLATNWLQHGVYGQTQTGQQGTQIVPTDTRLPGYPAFLVAIFWLFGVDNFKAVMLTQILVDLGTCLIVADIARRLMSLRAARIAFLLAALCPFLANYASAVLTETLEMFFTALALDCAAAALNQMGDGESRIGTSKWWAATGAAIAACMLLRPDGGILLAAVLFYLLIAGVAGVWRRGAAALAVILFTLALLAPWTLRNFRTLHHLQPLAPRYANETDELVPRGFNRWVKTWIVDYASVEEIYWNVPGGKIDPAKLPSRASDPPAEKGSMLNLIADYNETQDMTLDLDARFGDLAAERIRAHPVRYYAVLPLLRVADMWLRPRTEILPPDVRWWEFNDDKRWSALAVGLGLLNLAYVGAAVWVLFRQRQEIRWAGLLISFWLLRSAFLGTLENPEPRYTLECYPVIVVLASSFLAGKIGREESDRRST